MAIEDLMKGIDDPAAAAKGKMKELFGNEGEDKEAGKTVEIDLASKLSSAIQNLEPVKVSEEVAKEIEDKISDNMTLEDISSILSMAVKPAASITAVSIEAKPETKEEEESYE